MRDLVRFLERDVRGEAGGDVVEMIAVAAGEVALLYLDRRRGSTLESTCSNYLAIPSNCCVYTSAGSECPYLHQRRAVVADANASGETEEETLG